MPVLLSAESTAFPPLRFASKEGLLAIGGDLARQRLLEAYSGGIFPWYDASTPILWWSPPERCTLLPESLHIPRSLARSIRACRFCITLDTAFDAVIDACAASPRPGQNGTWLVPEMRAAYSDLHTAGYAHSVEAWQDGELAGGLYGVALGGVFFGESMFFNRPDASKTALVWLVRLLHNKGFALIDCQQVTDNLLRFGAAPVRRNEFMQRLRQGLSLPAWTGQWKVPADFFPLWAKAQL